MGDISQGTLYKDANHVEVLNAYLANMRICDITPDIVRRLQPAIKADKVRERGKFSNTTLAMYYQTLKQIMRAAASDRLIPDNPCEAVKAPTRNDPNREGLRREDAARLLEEIANEEGRLKEAYAHKEVWANYRHRLFTRETLRGLGNMAYLQAVRIALATGMRRGEVFALAWDNVDLAGGVIHVRKSLTNTGYLKAPKSKNGIRDIHIDAAAVASLTAWADFQKRELHKLRLTVDGSTPVCCSGTGGFADLPNFERWWGDFRTRAGFPSLKFHELRHTQASLLIGNGVDVKTVQTRLGHYSAALTLDWYAHANPDNDKAAGDMMGDLLKKKEAVLLTVKTA